VFVLCLDLEGVLVPEVWQAVAEATGIEELRKTTRDIPVYDDLMQMRLAALAKHGVRMSQIMRVIAALEPLPGAAEFLSWARSRYQVAIISDTFYEFAAPLMAQLGHPLILCHHLEIENDLISGYRIRQEDPKRRCVAAFKSLAYQVLAAGDSFNDVSMLDEADAGFFFQAPANVVEQFPMYPCAANYAELSEMLIAVS
jgi:phosphoserine/homoserine phosphotransferase